MNNTSNIDVFLKVEARWITVEYGITLDFTHARGKSIFFQTNARSFST